MVDSNPTPELRADLMHDIETIGIVKSNDVLQVRRRLEIAFAQGWNETTISPLLPVVLVLALEKCGSVNEAYQQGIIQAKEFDQG